jgi:hypothetical protein
MVEEGFLDEVADTGIKMRNAPLTTTELSDHLKRGNIPIVLISAWRLSGDKEPHWVVLTASDDRFIYINDPYPEPEKNRFDTDCIGIPITPEELTRMMRFGSRKHFASVVILPPRKDLP